jgi:cyclase
MVQRPRIIPALLISGTGLYKTVRFKNRVYLGDPLNTVRIFNDREVDEIVFLDIDATTEHKGINHGLLRELAAECFMPVTYGGGVRSLQDVEKIIACGIEKVAINSATVDNSSVIEEAAASFGSQSIVASIDIDKSWTGRYRLTTYSGKARHSIDPFEHARTLQERGVGEIMVTAVHRDGTYEGYDLEMMKEITSRTSIPIIACGGASSLNDMHDVISNAGAHAAAAGSIFVYRGRNQGVLINYPSQQVIDQLFSTGKESAK